MAEALENENVTPLEAAREYVRRGWSVVPIPYKTKRAVYKEWEQLRLKESDLSEYFDQPANIGLILGEPSGWLVDVDLDCPEARAIADKYLPATEAKTGRTGIANSHWWYYAPDAETAQHRDPTTQKMMVELRSTGAQTVVGPSIHPDDGSQYEVLRGEPACVPAPMLTACVEALAKRVLEMRYGSDVPQKTSQTKKPPKTTSTVANDRPQIDSQQIERRALAYLDKIPSAISGQSGHGVTYTAATVLVHGFEIHPERALDLLLAHYNPRCTPPWSEKELRHKVEDAAKKSHSRSRGWLLESEPADFSIHTDIDLSGILGTTERPSRPTEASPTDSVDPGPYPESLLFVPGFIDEAMVHNLATAHRPQPVLALGAAITLLATLTGRKVCDETESRTNLYCLGVCPSGMGKEHARQINKQILYLAGAQEMIGPEGLASHAGLISAVEQQPAILLQLDEIGRLLRTLSDAGRSPHLFHIATNLMKLFTSSNSLYIGDAYADPKRNKVIPQPHACVYGTTSPRWLYEGLTAESISDGFLSRILLFEAATHVSKQRKVTKPIPEPMIETARWWFEFSPGGNLANEHPQPLVIETDNQALQVFEELDELAEGKQLQLGEPLGTLWTRATEKARKLALIYACSADHHNPKIDVKAAQWSCAVSDYLTRRMIYLAGQWIAENPYDAKRKRVLRLITDAGPAGLKRSQLYAKTRALTSRERNEVIEALLLCGDVRMEREVETGGAPCVRYVANVFPEGTS